MRLPVILAVFLVVFLGVGFWSEKKMKETEKELRAVLHEVERHLAAKDREKALKAVRRFEQRWAKTENTWALITDHHEMDQIDLALDRVDRYLTAGSLAEAEAELASLIFLVRHIPRKETLGVRSVF